MSNQEVFNGLSCNWLYASMSSSGAVRVHTEKPELSPKGGMHFNKDATCRRADLDPDVIHAGFTGEIWERSQPLVGAPPYATNGKGVALAQPVSCEPQGVISQDIFKHFGSNWTWASIDRSGQAWLHTYEPNTPQGKYGVTLKNVRAPAFDLDREFPERINVKRLSFLNGPTYDTDEFGIALNPPPAAPQAPAFPQPRAFAPAPQPMAPPAAVTITVDQAESGSLWDFANSDENYVSVNQYGVVWFNTHKDGCGPRRSYAVQVEGVTHVIERTRSQPRLAPPEAGKPFANDHALPMPETGLREDGSDEAHGWTNELDEAKERAHRLLRVFILDGDNERPALNEMQYMAIFGELPE